MSIPLSSACSPFALEMINGRFPAGAGESGSAPKAFRLDAPSAPTAPNRFAPHACLFLWRILNGKLRDFGENNFWLGGLDSNQDSQIQSLESYQLDDLPAGGTKTNRGTFPLIGTSTILLI